MTKKKNVVEAPPERMPSIVAPVLPKLIQQLRGEAPIEGELVESSSAIAEYRPTAAALAGMREALAGKEWDLTTVKGNEEARQTRLVLVRLRTSLEAERKRLKQPHLDAGKLIDDEAKRITAAIEEMENPLDKLIKDDENRREREKQEREAVAAEHRRQQILKVGHITHLPLTHIGASADGLREAIAALEDDGLHDFDEEHLPMAEAAREQALVHLRTNLEARVAADERAAETLKREQAVKEDQARQALDTQRQQAINHITLWPARAAGKRAAEIAGFLQAASTESITIANFGPREPEAQAARAEAVNQLKAMHVAALASEEQAAKLQALEDEKLQAEATAQAARDKDAQISAQIKCIRDLVNQANDNASSGEIGQYIDRLVAVRDGIPLGDTSVYGERTQDMHEAIEQTINSLQVAAARALREEQAEAQRNQQEADDARMRIQNATLREAVVAVLEWADEDDNDGYMLPNELLELCRAALANDEAKPVKRRKVAAPNA
jgi:hypothetical protein